MENSIDLNRVFSKKTFLCLKGYLALCIIFHHLYQFTGLFQATYFGHFLNLLGRFAAFSFMFISGFGLYSSYSIKGLEYIRSFPKKRILPFYFTYIFFFIIYLLYDCLFANVPSVSSIITSLTFGGTIISFGWYLQVALIVYLAFYFTFRLSENPKIRSFVILSFTIIYTVAAWKLGFSSNHISVVYAFPLGLFIAQKQKSAEAFFKKNSAWLSVLFFLIFFSGYMIYVQSEIMGKFDLPAQLKLIIAILSESSVAMFMLSTASLLSKTKIIANLVSSYLGKYSLEIYCIQGLLFIILRQKISNPRLFAAVAMIILFPVAMLLNRILHIFLKGLSKLFKN